MSPAAGERRSSADGASSTTVVFTPVVPIDHVESAASPVDVVADSHVESAWASAQYGKNLPSAVNLESEAPTQPPLLSSAATGASFLTHGTAAHCC